MQQLRKRGNTRARLLEAAADLCAENGATRLSIDEVCRRAGFTRGAFYSNFGTLDELLFALYEAKSDALLAAIGGLHLPVADEDQGPADPPAGGLVGAVDDFLAVVPADPQWYSLRVSFALRTTHEPEIERTLHAHAEDLRRRLTPYVEGMADREGILLADPDEATRVVIAAHVGAVLQGPFVDDPEQLRRDTVLAAMRGLGRREADGA